MRGFRVALIALMLIGVSRFAQAQTDARFEIQGMAHIQASTGEEFFAAAWITVLHRMPETQRPRMILLGLIPYSYSEIGPTFEFGHMTFTQRHVSIFPVGNALRARIVGLGEITFVPASMEGRERIKGLEIHSRMLIAANSVPGDRLSLTLIPIHGAIPE